MVVACFRGDIAEETLHDLAAMDLQDVGLDFHLSNFAGLRDQAGRKHRPVFLVPMLRKRARDRRVPFLGGMQHGLVLADQFQAVIAAQ